MREQVAPQSLVSFVGQHGLHSARSLLVNYHCDPEIRYRVHALIHTVIGISCYWNAPLIAVAAAFLSCLFPSYMAVPTDRALSSFWFSLPQWFILIVPAVAIGSVLLMTHVVTVPIISQMAQIIGAVFAAKLGSSLFVTNWRKELTQAKAAELENAHQE